MPGRHRKPRSRGGRHRHDPPAGRWASPVLAGLIVLGISGVGAVTALNQRPASLPADRSPAAVTPTLNSPSSSPSSSPSPTPPAAPASHRRPHAVRRPARYVLTVTATGRVSWVSVTTARGRTLFAGMLRHGRTVHFRTHPLTVVIGDAGAVRLVVHQHVHSPAGHRGEVLQLSVR